MSKTREACKMTIERMLEGKKHCYLWTFTFKERENLRDAAKMWSKARFELVRSLGFSGVRVYELHPGGHGLHIHVVTRTRFHVNQIRRITNRHGLGRIDVLPIPAAEAVYVCKYLTKQGRAPCLKGFRLWGAIGDVSPVKVKNIMVIGHLSYCFHKAIAWMHGNLPIPRSEKAERFRTMKSLAMEYYSKGQFEGYETWRDVKMHLCCAN